MIVKVRVVPNAAQNKVVSSPEGLRVFVKAPAEGGRANKQLVEVLAEHFATKKSGIKIIQGGKSREKVIEVSKSLKTQG